MVLSFCIHLRLRLIRIPQEKPAQMLSVNNFGRARKQNIKQLFSLNSFFVLFMFSLNNATSAMTVIRRV